MGHLTAKVGHLTAKEKSRWRLKGVNIRHGHHEMIRGGPFHIPRKYSYMVFDVYKKSYVGLMPVPWGGAFDAIDYSSMGYPELEPTEILVDEFQLWEYDNLERKSFSIRILSESLSSYDNVCGAVDETMFVALQGKLM